MDLVKGNYLLCSIRNNALLKMKNQTFDCEASNIFGKNRFDGRRDWEASNATASSRS